MISKYEECLPHFLINDLNNSFSLEHTDSSLGLRCNQTYDSASLNSTTSPSSTFSFLSSLNYLSYLTNQRDTLVLQNLIQSMTNDELDNVINSLLGNFVYLMKEQNGNYFCSDLLKKASPPQRKIIYDEISAQFYGLCFDSFGTHSIQTLIEVSNKKEEKIKILQSLYSKETNKKLINDKNGTYVIQKVLLHIDELLRLDINNIIIENFNTIAFNVNGVCIIKQFLYSNYSPNYRSLILNQIINNFDSLAKDKYGNYIIQELLIMNWGQNDISPIISSIYSKFSELASNKSSSHIIELFISKLDQFNRKIFFSRLLLSKQLVMLGKCQYGVFVLNTILSCFNNYERNIVIQMLQKQ